MTVIFRLTRHKVPLIWHMNEEVRACWPVFLRPTGPAGLRIHHIFDVIEIWQRGDRKWGWGAQAVRRANDVSAS